VLCHLSQGLVSLTSIFFSQIISVPSSNFTPRCTSSRVTGITCHSVSNILQASSSQLSKLHLISASAVSNIFQILFQPITQVSQLNLYSNNFLTNQVSGANAATALLISPGGNTQYLSLISQVVQPESVMAIIAANSLSSLVKTFFKP
jgi:hypothetical protein